MSRWRLVHFWFTSEVGLESRLHAKRQHYVPRFLLRNFAPAREEQVHVYDKSNDRVFRAHIANVAAESGF